jgi:hypothetical protein
MAGIIYQWLANSKMPLSSMFRQLKADLKIRLENKASPETSKRQKAIRSV